MKTVFWDSTAKILINIIYGCIALFILSVIGLIVWARWTAGYPEPTTINNPNTVNIRNHQADFVPSCFARWDASF